MFYNMLLAHFCQLIVILHEMELILSYHCIYLGRNTFFLKFSRLPSRERNAHGKEIVYKVSGSSLIWGKKLQEKYEKFLTFRIFLLILKMSPILYVVKNLDILPPPELSFTL